MKTDLQVYDIVCNEHATRMVHGVLIQENHTCSYHSMPVNEIVYTLSSTTNHSWANTEWCMPHMEANGYHKMTIKEQGADFIEYQPYTDNPFNEPVVTHLYVLEVDDLLYIGMTSNIAKVRASYDKRAIKEIIKLKTALPRRRAVAELNIKKFQLSKQYDYRRIHEVKPDVLDD